MKPNNPATVSRRNVLRAAASVGALGTVALAEEVKAAPAEFWLWDGIHPSIAGHAIMARKWREVVGI